MVTLKEIIQNIKHGQSALRVRAVLNELERIYKELKPRISIQSCELINQENAMIVYLTIPSQKSKSKKYQMAIWIKTQDKMKLDTPIKVYSNSPSFLFNFAYVFNKRNALLFPEKFPKESKQIQPKTRNPYQTVGFDKHVFSAVRYISEYKIKNIIEKYSQKPIPDIPKIKI